MATQPFGHTPEANQFQVTEFDEDTAPIELIEDVDHLLKAAVMHLALLRSPGNKPTDESDTRDYDYMLHPIFSAFFVFSHRRKRKMTISAAELLGLTKSPHEFIPKILARNHRLADEDLPEQVLLFGAYYGKHPS